MKPTNDLFEQQVRSLYESYEVPSPASIKNSVFNELDSAKSGLFASKSILLAVSVITFGIIYMISDQPTQIKEVGPANQIKQVVAAPKVLKDEISPEEAVEIVEVKEPITTEQVVDPVLFQKTIISDEAVEAEESVVAEEPAFVVEEIKDLAQPVEVVETETPVVKEQEKNKEEEVKWVLPAKIKVRK